MKMDDIARLAGVSKASVSRVLNNKPNVSEKLRKKVEQVLEDYDYQPNLVAQALNTKKSKLIGVLLPAIGLDLFADIVDGISSTLQMHGYEMILADFKRDTKQAMRNLDVFRSKQVDGIIYFPTDNSPEHIAYINQFKIPLVILGHEPEGLKKKYVSFPDVKATEEIVQYFINMGCEKITHIAMPKGHAVGQLRVEAYLRMMKKNNLVSDVFYVDEITYEAGYEAADNINDSEAIFAAMDRLALGMMRGLLDKGTLSNYLIAGIDNMGVSKMANPSLTSIDFDYYHSGKVSGDMVLDLINGKGVASIVLPYKLYERESTRRNNVR